MSKYPSFNTIRDVEVNDEKLASLAELNIDQKINTIMGWLARQSRIKSNLMLYMIMYDIENNKIRTHIAKYLIKKGCLRIQKSVYLAKSSPVIMKEITETLKEINDIYENQDSIFVLPVPEEKFNNITVIGQNVEFEIVTQPKIVLFF
ncbi:MAG: CRISPR-associated endonuclease Cas2 [Chitinophagales bacterium]|nr:CRISPR-associated endonuclease Cas2 [Chitinophagales bacterium]